jgi:hypothetical protein
MAGRRVGGRLRAGQRRALGLWQEGRRATVETVPGAGWFPMGGRAKQQGRPPFFVGR